jgi:hypothetical protein
MGEHLGFGINVMTNEEKHMRIHAFGFSGLRFWKRCRVTAITIGAIGFRVAAGLSQSIPSPETILARSIAYHDPEHKLLNSSLRFQLLETRPGRPDRKTQLEIDVPHEKFRAVSRLDDSTVVEYVAEGEMSWVTLNGSNEFSEQMARKFRATPQRALFMRNYYTYLYGLPTKLTDAGTRLATDTVLTTFQRKEVVALRVTYDKRVGSDTWYFYFDPKTFALRGYRFYHDESKRDGEYIVLDGEATAGSVRLPNVREWYTNGEDRHLGTDTIESFQVAN